MSNVVPVTVKILGKDYQIACAPGEQQNLLGAAEHLDGIMADIKQSGKVFGLERIAVMAALNLSNELLTQKTQNTEGSATIEESVERSNKKLNDALHRLKQLEI